MEVEEVHIESDPALVERYGNSIPVIAVDGEPVLAAPLPVAQLRAVLARRLPQRGRAFLALPD